MSKKTLLAATAALGLAGFLLTQPAYSTTSASLDQGARTNAQPSAVILAQAEEKKKKGKKKAEKKKKKGGEKKKGKKSDD